MTMIAQDDQNVDRRAHREKLQSEAVNSAIASYRSGRDALIRAPVGFGKTRIFTRTADRIIAEDPKATVLIIQDRIKIAQQNNAAANKLGVADCSLAYDGDFDQSGRIVHATAATAFKNLGAIRSYSAVIIDECHHASNCPDSMHSAILSAVTGRNPNARVIGASATPRRDDGCQLHPRLQSADRITISYGEGYDTGAIVRPATKSISIVGAKESVASLVARTVDPNNPLKDREGLNSAIRRGRPADFYDQCVSKWQQEAKGAATFAYCDTIADTKKMVMAFEAAGISCGVVHSGLPKSEIDAAYKAFDTGQKPVLISVDMLTEGVDSTRAACILNTKATTTPNEYTQMIGRAMRAHTEITAHGPVEKKQALVLEAGASAMINGSIEVMTDVESFATRGYAGSSFKPWTQVQKIPQVLAIHTGEKTIFAIRANEKEPFRLFVKADAQIPGKRTTATAIEPYKDMPKANPIELAKLAQSLVETRLTIFSALQSQTVIKGDKTTTRLREICRTSFAESKGSLEAFITPQKAAAPQPMQRRAAYTR